jgi:flagellar basal-body rod protein FlgC
MDLTKALTLSTAGMKAQGTRLRIIAENIANANSAAPTAGEQPYRRKIVTFRNELDRAAGVNMVEVDKVKTDNSEFQRKYDPGHPSADAQGYVLLPNVSSLVEMADMREATRSYEANVSTMDLTKQMLLRTIDILRG